MYMKPEAWNELCISSFHAELAMYAKIVKRHGKRKRLPYSYWQYKMEQLLRYLRKDDSEMLYVQMQMEHIRMVIGFHRAMGLIR